MNKSFGLEKDNLILFALVLIARSFDIITTYIAGSGDLSGEMNILVRIFGLGWSSLLISEVIIICISYFILKMHTNKFYIEAEKKIDGENLSFGQYMSEIYFGKKISFVKSLYSKINFKIATNSFIQLFALTLILVSFVIGINNILGASSFINLYNLSNHIYKKNLPNILNLILFATVGFLYHYKKFKALNYKK